MRIIGSLSSGVAVGANGVATANTSTPTVITGKVHAIYVKYNDSPPAGSTDVVIKTVGSSPSVPSYNLLSLTNVATDGWFYPREQVCDNAGSAIADTYDYFPVADNLNVSIAGANAGDSVSVWILLTDI